MADKAGRLEGKIAIVTGAGSRGPGVGNGKATSVLFAREGAKVVVTDLDVERGALTAAQIEAEGTDGGAIFVPRDVVDEEQWRRAISKAVSTYGRLNVLIHSAGTASAGTVESTDVEQWDAMMAVHGKGVFLRTKHAIPEMRKAGGGSIVNTSSISGLVGQATMQPVYNASKGAVRIFTKSAAIQYAKEGIRVNSVHPGAVDTPMVEYRLGNPELQAQANARSPMGRTAQPEEIAYGVLYLASDESSFVTGSELVIDGGFTAQ